MLAGSIEAKVDPYTAPSGDSSRGGGGDDQSVLPDLGSGHVVSKADNLSLIRESRAERATLDGSSRSPLR